MSKFQPIRFPEPSDLIIEQILKLLKDGDIRPGEQLPAEPVLQQSFQVSKQQLKAAFRRLEIYGVVETRPQSGTYVSGFAAEILIALMDNILNMGNLSDPVSLVEARILIEEKAAELACEHMNEQDYQVLEAAHEKLVQRMNAGERGIPQDIYFHLELIRCCRNPVLISCYSMMIKELVKFWHDLGEDVVGSSRRLHETLKEHSDLMKALKARDGAAAKAAVQAHLAKVYQSVLRSDTSEPKPPGQR